MRSTLTCIFAAARGGGWERDAAEEIQRGGIAVRARRDVFNDFEGWLIEQFRGGRDNFGWGFLFS